QIARQSDRPRLGTVAHDYAAKNEAAAGTCGQAIAVFQQQPGDAASHGAAADQGDSKWLHVLRACQLMTQTAPGIACSAAGNVCGPRANLRTPGLRLRYKLAPGSRCR